MKVTRDFIALAISKTTNMPLMLLETALISRILGTIEFGQWILILAAAVMLHSFFINWTHSITLRFGSEEWMQNKSLSNTFFIRLPMIFIAMLAIIFLLFFHSAQWLSTFFSINPNCKWLVFFNMLSVWLALEAQGNLQATRSILSQAIITPSITGVSVIILLFILFHFGKSNLILIALYVTVIKCFFWAVAWLYALTKTTFYWRLPSYNNIKSAFFYAWPLIPTILFGYCSDWGDHVLIGLFCSAKDAGIWGAAYQLMLGIISCNSVFVAILLPWLVSRSQTSSDVQTYYVNHIIPSLLSCWLLAIILMTTFFPMLFFIIFGEQFNSAHTLILILPITIFTSIFSCLYGVLFSLQNRLKNALIYNLVIVAINISISFILIPKMGMVGAAIGTSLSYIIGHLLYILDQHLFLKVPIDKTGVLFLLSICLAILQFLAGTLIELRLICCLLSLSILIFAIRKTTSVMPLFLDKIFVGALATPIGLLFRHILVNKNAHEYR